MTPIEQLKHEARSMMLRAEQENDGPTVKRYAAQLAAVEALEADLESTRRALEIEVAENTKLREALEPFGKHAHNYAPTYLPTPADNSLLYVQYSDLRRAAQVLVETGGKQS